MESTTAIAQAHQHLADKIAAEVEHPIREFILRNNDWAGMKNMEGNLTVIAKSIESAEEKAEKLKKRGTKAKAQQVADAATAVQNAYADWDSQAPFVFERFQVADEARCNNLKDALTRLQTLELDRTQTSMQAVEGTLAQMLDIDATQETKAFANKATGGRQTMARRQSRTSSRGTGAAVNPSTPSIITDDAVSVQSSQSGGITPTGRFEQSSRRCQLTDGLQRVMARVSD